MAMVAPPAVIDLGVQRDVPVAEGAPRLLPGTRRWLGLAIALVAVLAAGGAAPVRGLLVELSVPARGGHGFSDADGLYLVDGGTIAKYRLPDAHLAWRVTLPGDARAENGFMFGGMVLLSGDGIDSPTTALDPATGEVRWRHGGSPSSFGPDRDVLMFTSYQPEDLTARHEVVEVATGAVLWGMTDEHAGVALTTTGRLVRWTPPDEVEVRDLRTGRVTASGRLPVTRGDIQVAGDLALVGYERDGRMAAHAFELERLGRRWTADIDLTNEYVADCGDLLCVGGGAASRVLDPATGRMLWATPGQRQMDRFGPVLLQYDLSTRPPGVQVLDPADGRVRGDIGGWEFAWPERPDGHVLAIRPSRRGGVWVAELDVPRGRARILGQTHEAFECRPGVRLVFCDKPDGTTGIWYPRA